MPRPARHGLLAASLLAGLAATRSAPASDAAACRELKRAFDLVKLGISSVQLNAILFSAAGKGCEPIDARNVAGSTALHAAAENDRLAVVRLLLDKGADPNLPGRSVSRRSRPRALRATSASSSCCWRKAPIRTRSTRPVRHRSSTPPRSDLRRSCAACSRRTSPSIP